MLEELIFSCLICLIAMFYFYYSRIERKLDEINKEINIEKSFIEAIPKNSLELGKYTEEYQIEIKKRNPDGGWGLWDDVEISRQLYDRILHKLVSCDGLYATDKVYEDDVHFRIDNKSLIHDLNEKR